MTGREFYNKYKNKKIIRDDGAKGIVVGVGGILQTKGIIALIDRHPMSWKNLDFYDYIYERLETPFGYAYIDEERITRTHTLIKFGRK